MYQTNCYNDVERKQQHRLSNIFYNFSHRHVKLEVESDNAEDQRREGNIIPRKYLVVSVAPNKAVIEADYIYKNNNSVTTFTIFWPWISLRHLKCDIAYSLSH